MSYKLLLICLLLALLSLASGKNVYINATALDSCIGSTPCYFLDPLLWQNNLVPETNDTVFVVNAPINTVLVHNSSLNLEQILLEGNVTLRLVQDAELTIQVISLSASASLVIEENSTVISGEQTQIQYGSFLVVNSAQGYAQDGIMFSLSENSTLILQRGYFGLHALEAKLFGIVQILPDTLFVASNALVVFQNNVVEFQNEPIIYNASFLNANVTFKQGWRKATFGSLTASNVTIYNNSQNAQQNFTNFHVDQNSTLFIRGVSNCLLNSSVVTGTLYISSSTVTIPTGTFNAPLVLSGLSTFSVPTLILKSVSGGVGENGEAPNVTITTGILHTMGDIEIPYGLLNVSVYAYFDGVFRTAGSVHVFGDVYAESSIIDVFTNFSLESTPAGSPSQYTLELQDSDFSAFHFSVGSNSIVKINESAITCDHTYFHPNSSFHYQNSDFLGEVYTEGRIHIGSNLTLKGNFTQGKEGILEFKYIDVKTRTSGVLNVAGDATLDGTISYALEQDPTEKGKIEILAVTAQNIIGKFSTEPVNTGLARSVKTSVNYSPKEIYLVFEKTEGKKKSTWWIWFLVVILVLATAGVGYYFYRKRRSYQYTVVPS
eukprot:Phypoly_transcript_04757.p1 GENE.Phypoly_transcript_04757~~Phypoly_transcript_04757.p1  ORF type:complete len:604 (+),score=71.75 Phypoly_transcript_04757:177-1988(+)